MQYIKETNTNDIAQIQKKRIYQTVISIDLDSVERNRLPHTQFHNISMERV